MDTISRENNSMLPVGGIIVGVIGLLLGGIALVQISKANKLIADHQVKIDKIDSIEQQANAANTNADKANAYAKSVYDSTQKAFNEQVGPALAKLSEDMLKMQDSMKKPVVAAKSGGGPAVAAPGEYVVKAGDTGAKIARTNGVSLGDLQAVNPGVEWTKLKPGVTKLKLPKK